MTTGLKNIVFEQNLWSCFTWQTTNTTNTFTPSNVNTTEHIIYNKQACFTAPTFKHNTYINMDSWKWQHASEEESSRRTMENLPSSPPSNQLLKLSQVSLPLAGQSAKERRADLNRLGLPYHSDDDEEGEEVLMRMSRQTLQEEEEEKRRRRREKNKLAAARCRKRRFDQRQSLQQEVNLWQGNNKALQEQIEQLQEEKKQLAFILEAHNSVCSKVCLAEQRTVNHQHQQQGAAGKYTAAAGGQETARFGQ